MITFATWREEQHEHADRGEVVVPSSRLGDHAIGNQRIEREAGREEDDTQKEDERAVTAPQRRDRDDADDVRERNQGPIRVGGREFRRQIRISQRQQHGVDDEKADEPENEQEVQRPRALLGKKRIGIGDETDGGEI